jgi:hypothetical protein
MACECGAYKTYKAPQGDKVHSDWCPWSSFAPYPKACQGINDAGWCFSAVEYWVKFSATGPKFWYCWSCYRDAQTSNQGIYDYGLP